MLFALVTKVASFALILLLPFCKLIILFMVVVEAMSFTLLKNYANWCCSCTIPIHHWNMVLFTLVTKVVSFALFLILPFYKFVLLFSIIVGVVNFTLLKLFASWCCSYVVVIHHLNLVLFMHVIEIVNFALFLFSPFYKLFILFMIVVGAVSLILLKLFANWCYSCAALVHH
jgi:hypothetical protein